MRLGGIYLDVGARTTTLKRDLAKAKGLTKKAAVFMRQELGRIGFRQAALAATAFGVSVAVLGKKMIDVGRSFESNMKTVQAWSGATGDDLKALTAIAKEMGATTEWSATQSAEALKFLAAAGFSAEQSMAALPETLNLATAGQVDLAAATDITTDVLTAFGLGVDELTRVNDAFITTASSSNTNVMMLGQSFKMVAPTAKLFGLSIEETAAMLGTLANSGVKAEMAGSGLNMVLLKTSLAAKKLGMDVESSLIEVLKEMKEQQWGATEIGEAFGARQVKTAAILMNSIGAYEKLTGKINENAGATGKLAAIVRDSLDNDFKILNSTIEDQLLKVYDDYKEEMRGAVQGTTRWIQVNKDLIDNMVELVASLGIVAKAMGTVVKVGAKFANVWVKTWQALGLASAGQITYTEALLVGAGNVDEFNKKLEKQNVVLEKNKEIKESLAVSGGGGAKVATKAEIDAAQEVADAKRDILEESQWAVYDSNVESLNLQTEFSNAEIADEKRKAELKKQIQKDAAASAISNAMLAFKMLGQHSKTAFGVFKAFAIAETLIDTYRAAQGAYAALAKINPALGIAAAAAATASGLARVQQIKSMTPGGGGAGGGGGGGGVGTYPVNPATGLPDIDTGESESRGTVTINIQGDFIGDESYIDLLVERINEAEDRDVYINQSNYAVETL